MSPGAYRRIHTARLWSSEMRTFRRRDRNAHDGLVYLLTGPASNFIGLYRLPMEWAAHDLCVSAPRFRRIIKALVDMMYATYDESASVVYVPLALEMDPISTEQQALGAVRQIESLPPTSLVSQFRADILRRLPSVKKPEALRPLLEFLGVVPEKGQGAPGLTPPVTPLQTSGPTRTPSPSPSPSPSGDNTTGGRRKHGDLPDVLSQIFQSRNVSTNTIPTVPLTEAERVYDEFILPMTGEVHMRDQWLKALRHPGAIEAVEQAANALNGANGQGEIRKPGAFLWAKFQEILGDSGVRQ
jgi:hypothetical protein